MRIVTWNLKHDSGSAVWPRVQAALGADIVLLQESRRPSSSSELAWEHVPHHDRGSAVLVSKGAIRSITIAGYEGWVVGGEWLDGGQNRPGRPLSVFSVHAPTSNAARPRHSYVEEVVGILDAIRHQLAPQSDLIVGGDFNFLSLGQRKEGEQLETTQEELAALTHFEDLGLVSCWAAAHPGRSLVQTLRWSGDKTPDKSTPYHCDGIFVPASWQPGIICEVLTSACFEVSDHYPVAAWISR